MDSITDRFITDDKTASYLNEHKFRHNFRNTVSPMFDRGSEIESKEHFLLLYPFFTVERNFRLEDTEGFRLFYKNKQKSV